MKMLARMLDLLFPPRETERVARDATPEMVATLLSPRTLPLPDADIVALFPYRELAQALIREAKFHRDMRSARLLGNALADYLLEELADLHAYEKTEAVLVPVPLSEARRRERGYNQVEEICRQGCSQLKGFATLDVGVLLRTRDTLPQTSLGRDARLQNMKDAFRAAEALDPRALYIVIDDVVTTGATLSAARDALLKAGAERIRAIALAH